jgi:hypothetical protein
MVLAWSMYTRQCSGFRCLFSPLCRRNTERELEPIYKAGLGGCKKEGVFGETLAI